MSWSTYGKTHKRQIRQQTAAVVVDATVAKPHATVSLPWVNNKFAKVFVDAGYISDSRFVVPADLCKHPKHVSDIIKFHSENSDKMPSGTWHKEGSEWVVRDGHPPLSEWVTNWVSEAKPAYPQENGDAYRILTSDGDEYRCDTDCFEPIMLATDTPKFGITSGGIVVITDNTGEFVGACSGVKVSE